MKRPGPLAGLACLLACAGCAGSAREDDARSRASIVYGDPSPAGSVEDAVLLLRTQVDGEELLCSAALVAKNLALTARHCVSHLVQGPFDCTVRGELIDAPDGAGQLGLHLPADTLEFYGGGTPRTDPLARASTILSTLSSTICLNDIAFVVLDRAVDLPVLPMRRGRPAVTGEPVVLVGYGMDETLPDIIDFRVQPRKHKAGLVIAGVGPDSVDDGITTVPPRTLVLDGPSGCVADSGGPLLDAATSAVLGVYSLLDGPSCIDPDVRHELVHVPPFVALADEAFAAAGATPLLEPPPVSPRSDAGTDAAAEAGPAPEARRGSSDGGCAVAPRGTDRHPTGALLAAMAALGGAARRTRRPRRRLRC